MDAGMMRRSQLTACLPIPRPSISTTRQPTAAPWPPPAIQPSHPTGRASSIRGSRAAPGERANADAHQAPYRGAHIGPVT